MEEQNQNNEMIQETQEAASQETELQTAETQETEMQEAPHPVSPDRMAAAIEAILFTTGEATSLARIADVLGADREAVRECMEGLMRKYSAEEYGIKIIRLEDAYQMCTKEEFYDDLIRLEIAPKKPVLTDVILETLSIIAYKQPVTKAEIERIRGVNSDHAVNRLVEFNLVRELGRLNAPGRPILFGTTEEFLRNFGVESKEDLPPIDTMKVEDFKAEAEQEAAEKVDI